MMDHKEPWPGYFEYRKKEFELARGFFEPFIENGVRDKRLLEVGCGNGYVSSLFGNQFGSIHSIDLPFLNRQTHSIGIFEAKRYLEKNKVSNVSIYGASGTGLPFKSNMFDMVYNMFVLEHIKERTSAVKEFVRVVKPGGLIISLVPGWGGRFFYLFEYYQFLFQRGFQKIFSNLKQRSTQSEDKPEQKQANPIQGTENIKTFRDFKKIYWNFPFPQPHGEYKSYRDEFFGYLASTWKTLFSLDGIQLERFSVFKRKAGLPESYILIYRKVLS